MVGTSKCHGGVALIGNLVPRWLKTIYLTLGIGDSVPTKIRAILAHYYLVRSCIQRSFVEVCLIIKRVGQILVSTRMHPEANPYLDNGIPM